MTTKTVEVQRHDIVSGRPFDEVLHGLHAGLGHPPPGELQRLLDTATDWDSYRDAVERLAGSSGLMVFLELDLGRVIGIEPAAHAYRAVRIVAGNPVTMESMTRSTPAAGAFAPVTILVFEADDGVHLRYDTIVSLIGAEMQPDARGHAEQLDAAVLELLHAAAGAKP